MSIADKLTTIAENQQAVYDAGKQSEYDRFWDLYQKKGTRDHWVCAFAYDGWDDKSYQPKYPIIAGGAFGLQETFRNSRVADTKVPIYVRTPITKTAFNYCGHLERIPSLILEVPVTSAALMFANCPKLKQLNITCTGEGCFADSLDISKSTLLSRESIQSVILALDKVRHDGTDADPINRLTLSLDAVRDAFYQPPVYNEEGDMVEDERFGVDTDEWRELVSQKTNWSIVLI